MNIGSSNQTAIWTLVVALYFIYYQPRINGCWKWSGKDFKMFYDQLLRELIEGYGGLLLYNSPRYGSILVPRADDLQADEHWAWLGREHSIYLQTLKCGDLVISNGNFPSVRSLVVSGCLGKEDKRLYLMGLSQSGCKCTHNTIIFCTWATENQLE